MSLPASVESGPSAAGAGEPAGVKGVNFSLDFLVECDAPALLEMRDFHAAELAKVSAPHTYMLDLIETAIAEKYSEAAKIALEKAGKTHGKVSVDLPGGLKLSAMVGQRVEWDQDKLQAIAKSMPDMEQINHYFDIGFKVSEKIYKAIPPGDLRKQFDDARTTKLTPMKITLERKDAATAAQAAGG